MTHINIYPAGMREVAHAIDLFGVDRVKAHVWPKPVYIINLTEDEFTFAVEFFNSIGVTVEKVEDYERL